MAKILIKKSTVSGKSPVAGDLDIGELAVNTADAALYTKHSDGSIKRIGAPVQITGITLTSGSWSLNGSIYEYTYSNGAITANSIVDVIPANADIAIVQVAQIYPLTTSSAGSVKFYAKNAPTGNIGVTINITQKA